MSNEQIEFEPAPIDDLSESVDRSPRSAAPTIFVIHTTGDTHEDAVIRYYKKGKIGPHYMIGLEGVIHQFCPDNVSAYHAGLSTKQLAFYCAGRDIWSRQVKTGDDTYKTLDAPYSGYNTWFTRWNVDSPLKLLSGKHPNSVSLGIECLASHHIPIECFTDAQYASLASLIKQKASLYSIPIDRAHILGHYDANPLARCSSKGDRDPGANFNWDRLLTLCRGS